MSIAKYGVFITSKDIEPYKVFVTKKEAVAYAKRNDYKSVKKLAKHWTKTNPSVPKGKFIKCKAVKFNRNGSISIKK